MDAGGRARAKDIGREETPSSRDDYLSFIF